MKITQRFKEEMNIKSIKPQQTQQQIKLEQTISKEVESNTCPICFELMVPPNYSPILLFPCGHTFCKHSSPAAYLSLLFFFFRAGKFVLPFAPPEIQILDEEPVRV